MTTGQNVRIWCTSPVLDWRLSASIWQANGHGGQQDASDGHREVGADLALSRSVSDAEEKP
ncbi:hypothetical protein [Nonomuraea fuscirosea]|uniref:hypothetical protein n=1 Tax=Nonomuraea fuscirosea TaxID=1291556 RepID=UPI00340FAFB1